MEVNGFLNHIYIYRYTKALRAFRIIDTKGQLRVYPNGSSRAAICLPIARFSLSTKLLAPNSKQISNFAIDVM